jgi:hypothetical protein
LIGVFGRILRRQALAQNTNPMHSKISAQMDDDLRQVSLVPRCGGSVEIGTAAFD